MKIRVIAIGDQTFTYDQDADDIRQMLHGVEPGAKVPGELYDITDLDRSDMDADEYLIVTEDDGTPLWSGWLGGVSGPPPASALTPEGLAPALYLAYIEGVHTAALRSTGNREIAIASAPGYANLGREYQAGWLAAARKALGADQ